MSQWKPDQGGWFQLPFLTESFHHVFRWENIPRVAHWQSNILPSPWLSLQICQGPACSQVPMHKPSTDLQTRTLLCTYVNLPKNKLYSILPPYAFSQKYGFIISVINNKYVILRVHYVWFLEFPYGLFLGKHTFISIIKSLFKDHPFKYPENTEIFPGQNRGNIRICSTLDSERKEQQENNNKTKPSLIKSCTFDYCWEYLLKCV